MAALVQRLEGTKESAPVPQRLQWSANSSSPLEPDEERECDMQVGEELNKYMSLVGERPDFLGLSGGYLGVVQRQRLEVIPEGPRCRSHWAAICAAGFAGHVVAFVSREIGTDDDTRLWIRKQELLPIVRAISGVFFNRAKLLANQARHVADALDPRVASFLSLTLKCWFTQAREEDNPWTQWGNRLGVADEHIMMYQLAPALDLVLSTLLRMSDLLDPACKQFGVARSIAGLIRQTVPAALHARLPATAEYLRSQPSCDAEFRPLPKLAAVQSASLRPSWMQPRATGSS